MPTISAHLPDSWPLADKYKARLQAFDNRPGRYLLWLIGRDLAETPDMVAPMPSPVDPFVMEKLARVLLGHLKAGRMSAVMDGRDQVADLTELVEFHLLERERERNRLVAEEAADYGAPKNPPTSPTRGSRGK